METFNIPASVLKAAVMCAPVKHDDCRVYLNGVHVSRTIDGGLAVTSTDGHVLFRYQLQEKAPDGFPDDGIIIPLDAAKSIKVTSRQLDLPVSVALDDCESLLAFAATGMRVMFTPVSGKFPDVAGLWPAEVEPGGPGVYVDPALVKRAVGAVETVGKGLAYCYGSGCLFLSGAEGAAHAIVMGMTVKNEYRRPRL